MSSFKVTRLVLKKKRSGERTDNIRDFLGDGSQQGKRTQAGSRHRHPHGC